jgi:hypothetical protein
MNERYEQLMAQAWIEFAPDAKAVTKRFAELIVKDITTGQRELAKIMSDTGSEDQAYILRITASNIERKYGVE